MTPRKPPFSRPLWAPKSLVYGVQVPGYIWLFHRNQRFLARRPHARAHPEDSMLKIVKRVKQCQGPAFSEGSSQATILKSRFAWALVMGLFASANGHGSMVFPSPRNAIDKSDPRWQNGSTPLNTGQPGCTVDNSFQQFCGCFGSNGSSIFEPGQACLWFSQGCTPGCDSCDPNATTSPNTSKWDRPLCLSASGIKPKLCSPEHRTLNRNAECGSVDDWTRFNPWRSPGAAPIYDSCGKAGGQNRFQPIPGADYYITTEVATVGDLGSIVLPYSPSGTTWRAGSVVKAAWTIKANHGGGYQWRLCPRSKPLTEECFRKTPLAFAGIQQLQFAGESLVHDIVPVYVSNGTVPVGSTWARNPIPIDPTEFEPPCKERDAWFPEPVPYANVTVTRCFGHYPANTLIIDSLRVPSSLPAGDYVLGWRWDAEQTAQVWSNCADIEVAN